MSKIYHLPCYDGRKSFYGKATVIEDNSRICLKSYDTIVGYLDCNHAYHRTWSGYSATTMRHVNSFLRLFGVQGGGKSWWDNLPVEAS